MLLPSEMRLGLLHLLLVLLLGRLERLGVALCLGLERLLMALLIGRELLLMLLLLRGERLRVCLLFERELGFRLYGRGIRMLLVSCLLELAERLFEHVLEAAPSAETAHQEEEHFLHHRQ
jgi:hypothetical protein